MGLTDKVCLLSHPEFYQKNLELIVEMLLKNDYPIHFIFETIMVVRIKCLINKKTLKQKS